MIPQKNIICHYSEVGLKGRNRYLFEQKLVNNIKLALNKYAPGSFNSIENIYGRIVVNVLNKAKEKKLKEALKNVCGLANFSFAYVAKLNFKDIQNTCYQVLGLKKFKTFRITASRSNKNFPLTSQEINEKIGRVIEKKLNKKVKLKNPQLTCFIEITNKNAFIYFKKISAVGGLPVGISGKVITLISGGIDSPVASFYANKRGLKNIFIHFHSLPYTSQNSIDKVKEIIKLLNKFQYNSILYLIPFAEIQKQILANSPAKLRVILYRRFMARIGQALAQKQNCRALVSGESLGQVASQTLENITAIQEAVNIPILRPLIGMDKQEIIQKAKKIGTFDISILPYEDCCTRFMPKNPEIKAKIQEIKKAEKKLRTKKLLNKALKEITVEKIN